jgi:hypothetical protein
MQREDELNVLVGVDRVIRGISERRNRVIGHHAGGRRWMMSTSGGTPVKLGSINPGVLPTDLRALGIRPEQARHIRRFINLCGDRVETVAPALAKRVLNNQRHGARIQWLTPRRLLMRLLQASFRQRQVIDPHREYSV